jgi:hypothetical protein
VISPNDSRDTKQWSRYWAESNITSLEFLNAVRAVLGLAPIPDGPVGREAREARKRRAVSLEHL